MIRIRKSNQSRTLAKRTAPHPNVNRPLNPSTLRIKLCLFLIIVTSLFVVMIGGSTYVRNVSGNYAISFIDFIKYKNITYKGMENAIVSHSNLIDKRIGTVEFMLGPIVSNLDYRARNNDAAYRPKGTPIYSIEGLSSKEFIAVKDKSVVNGYKIYISDDVDYKWLFKDLPKDSVTEISLYYRYHETSEGFLVSDPILTITKKEDISKLISLLENGSKDENYKSNNDFKYYRAVFHTGEIISYDFTIRDDLAILLLSQWEE